MAKDNKQHAGAASATHSNQTPATETVTEAPAAAPVVVAAAASAGNSADGRGKAKVLTNGERRIDFIQRRWAEGATRSAILKEIIALGEPADTPYQIVFGGTKGLVQGKPLAEQKAALAAAKAAKAAAKGTPAPASAPAATTGTTG